MGSRFIALRFVTRILIARLNSNQSALITVLSQSERLTMMRHWQTQNKNNPGRMIDEQGMNKFLLKSEIQLAIILDTTMGLEGENTLKRTHVFCGSAILLDVKRLY
jgi:hypothetical protein